MSAAVTYLTLPGSSKTYLLEAFRKHPPELILRTERSSRPIKMCKPTEEAKERGDLTFNSAVEGNARIRSKSS